jgi:hypothetical protein
MDVTHEVNVGSDGLNSAIILGCKTRSKNVRGNKISCIF